VKVKGQNYLGLEQTLATPLRVTPGEWSLPRMKKKLWALGVAKWKLQAPEMRNLQPGCMWYHNFVWPVAQLSSSQ
jgi:hypothetical protein